jgi:hypothetical protein
MIVSLERPELSFKTVFVIKPCELLILNLTLIAVFNFWLVFVQVFFRIKPGFK